MKEGAIVREILDALSKLGIEAWRTQSGQVRVRGAWIHLAPEGTPDILGYLDGGTLFGIECKTPHGKTQKRRAEVQNRWGERLTAKGGVYILARSADEALRGLGFQSSPASGGDYKEEAQPRKVVKR